ncbi:MAG: arginine--tRNA ligase [Planctomycetaceae bacterium]|jgi:arginyl-tRNA synthetase|nr:arginine--tRNA ligase [Planctomycetaceae bacterium]
MILPLLKTRFASALQTLVSDADAYLDMIRPSQDAKFGDFQANMAMPIARKKAEERAALWHDVPNGSTQIITYNARDIARQIIEKLDISDICAPPEIAGPGFINLRLHDEFIQSLFLKAVADEDRLGISVVEPAKRKTYLVDYSGPNVAKPMHVGHIRSTVIGNALARMLQFQGHHVITDNHLGDWGTQFGMIIFGYKNFLNAEAYRKNPIEELSRLYRLVRQKMDEEKENDISSGINVAVLQETAKLHAGDAENRRIWQEVLPHSQDEINRIYARLNISFDHTLGESFYNPMLPGIVEDLLKRKIAVETNGAVGVFFDKEEDRPAGEGRNAVPMLIRKSDGAFLYGTTDLATVQYRINTFKPDAILYVVDFRQSQHFDHLFKTVQLMGIHDVELEHVKFGTVLGEDGKPFKTRSGDTVGLNGLLDEAERRAYEIVKENDKAETPESELRDRARRIGIGAIIYADLSQNRESDYVFSYDKMLAMTGNTATYMQYAFARVRSIFAKGNIDVAQLRQPSAVCRLPSLHPAERALALELLKFGEAVDLSLRDYRPNGLTAYLFELSNRYSVFFEQCPVLKADQENVRIHRLMLCDLTARTLQKGLELLGIETVERM